MARATMEGSARVRCSDGGAGDALPPTLLETRRGDARRVPPGDDRGDVRGTGDERVEVRGATEHKHQELTEGYIYTHTHHACTGLSEHRPTTRPPT
jgi:hypothetical protein